MIKPRIRVDDGVPAGRADVTQRTVQIVLRLDWAQALHRLQQLHNEGRSMLRITEDAQGHVRIEPDD
jgi:hypothetical protein